MRKLAEQMRAEEQEMDMGHGSAAGINSGRHSDTSENDYGESLLYREE